MFFLLAYMRCIEHFSEILMSDQDDAKRHLFNMTVNTLKRRFGEVAIRDIAIHCLPEYEEGSPVYSIVITAHCARLLDSSRARDLLGLEATIESDLSCTLLELVGGRVDVEEVEINELRRRERLAHR